VGQDGILLPIGNRHSWIATITIALRAIECDENRHRPITNRPQDAILPYK